MENSIGPLRGSTTAAPRTPETQHLSSVREGTRFFNQQTEFEFSVRGYEKDQAWQRPSRSQRAAQTEGSPLRISNLR
jgi:hypothetical protein